MPISRQVTLTTVLVTFSLDVPSMTAHCVFQNYIDGAAASTSEFDVVGADLAGVMAAAPDSTKTRADDITDAIYAYAISKHFIAGTVE
jgi:hypothetical protein